MPKTAIIADYMVAFVSEFAKIYRVIFGATEQSRTSQTATKRHIHYLLQMSAKPQLIFTSQGEDSWNETLPRKLHGNSEDRPEAFLERVLQRTE